MGSKGLKDPEKSYAAIRSLHRPFTRISRIKLSMVTIIIGG